jgi:hypothetical protein
VPGQPGRGLSANNALTASRKRLGFDSNLFKSAQPCSHRFRQKPTVSSHKHNSSAMALLVRPWLIASTICARCTKLCGTSRLRIIDWMSSFCSGDKLIGVVGRAIVNGTSKKAPIIQSISRRWY